MTDTATSVARALEIGQVLCGFRVDSVETLPEIDGRAVIMHHEELATPLMWLANNDINKSFAIAFKTPPQDNTGVFHIIEHSVLCGSTKFPVKEPFVNLLKTSMQTFLNAMTFPDKTMYPVASTNEKDLLNLMDVYMDAVLNPLIYEKQATFEQEGWHREVAHDDSGAHALYNGVVYNEMKGELSNPDTVGLMGLSKALFPDMAYGFESGGNPDAIPSLSYEEFLDTHARHYNMKNAHIILYGDIRLTAELELLNEYCLRAAQKADMQTVALEPNPLTLQTPVIDDGAVKYMATSPENHGVYVGYVIGTYRDRCDILACDILCDALMGSNESPLKALLLEADLGFDVDSFVFEGLLQPFIVFSLRGAAPDAAEAFRTILQEEFKRMVREGIPRKNLEAALDAADFSLRERDYGTADGVVLAISAMAGWLYDESYATTYLRYEDAIKTLRAGLDTSFWEDLVQRIFVNSAHRGCCEVIPAEEQDEPELPVADGGELAHIERAAQDLKRIQDMPDSPQALATLPHLSIADIEDAPPEPAFEICTETPLPCIFHDLPTRKIDYAAHFFDISRVSWDDIPYVTLLCSLLGKLDTDRLQAHELDLCIQSRLGILTFDTLVVQEVDTDCIKPYVVVSASSLNENLYDLASLPQEIWQTTHFDDLEKIKTILQQQKLSYEQAFTASGNSYALARAWSYTDPKKRLTQHFGNVDYYRFICSLLDNWETQSRELPLKLNDIVGLIFCKGSTLHSFCGARPDLDDFWTCARDLGLCEAVSDRTQLQIPQAHPANEAFIIPANICFVAKAAGSELPQSTYSGSWEVACQALNFDYLWNEIRVKGGAYGCGVHTNSRAGVGFHTFRDPNLDASLARIDAAGEWLDVFRPCASELEGYIVSCIAAHDMPLKPHRVARRQDLQYLIHRDTNWRQELRTQKLQACIEHFAGLVEALRTLSRQGRSCVFGSEEIIAKADSAFEVVELISAGSQVDF